MNIDSQIKSESSDIKEILKRIKKKDFTGNTGIAVKNSTYQFSKSVFSKIGSLLFTIILARLLLPELYGLYGLALSTILFLGVFNDLGISAALNTFVSKTIDKFPGKAKGYFIYLTKWRMGLLFLSLLLLVFLGKWLAIDYYHKPIYYALLAGTLYLPFVVLQSHLTILFTSTNNFKPLLIEEIILQVLRLTIIPLLIILSLSKIGSTNVYLLGIFAALSFCYFIASMYFYLKIKENDPFKKSKTIKLSHKEKENLIKFILPLIATAFSGVVFGYIDQIMLGHYVASTFLGFYQASFNLVASAATIMAFSSIAMFPILARLRGEKLEKGFKKSRNLTLFISIIPAMFTFILAPLIIKIIYGSLYLTSTIYLQILSVLIISFPLIALYTTYYTCQKKTRIFSVLLILSTLVNIILNYFFIRIGAQINMSYAVMGACIATIMSRLGYLAGLIIFRRRR